MSTAPISGITPELAAAQPVRPAASASAGNSTTSASASARADTRLVIEDDKAAGSYVYVTIDPVTGQVISQIPREQLLKLREASDYTPGSIVNARS
jgi:flagellar protein FlaG